MTTNKTSIELLSGNALTASYEVLEMYIHYFISGNGGVMDDYIELWKKMAEICNHHNCDKILVEESILDQLSVSVTFQGASLLPQLGFASIKIAFADRFIEQQYINKFGENVAVNRGITIKVFNKPDVAKKWLLQD